MSDLLVVPGAFSTSGSFMMAKNSHTAPNEAQGLCYIPAMSPGPGATLRCTLIEIPQVSDTHAIMLSRPSFAWGGEMGVNEHGVTIANIPVFTRLQTLKPGLLGVDLVRLALERSTSAREALDVIVALIAQHGQGGRASHRGRLYHHDNSFVLADRDGIWKLETAGRHYVAAPITAPEGLSNHLTIEGDYALSSEGIEEGARSRRFIKRRENFGFARAFTNRSMVRACHAKPRREIAQTYLDGLGGAPIGPQALMNGLRAHTEGAKEPIWSALNGGMGSVCMHGGGLVEARQTTASFIWDGGGEGWYTGTSAPCLASFKPVAFDPKLKAWAGPMPGVKPDTQSIFWRNEHLHRMIACVGWQRPRRMREEIAHLEATLLAEAPPSTADFDTRREYLVAQWTRARKSLEGWIEGVQGYEPQVGHLRTYWEKRSREVGLPLKGL